MLIAAKRLAHISVLILAILSAGCAPPSRTPGDKIIVAASIAPLADFCRQVGGDKVQVSVMLPPGANPHTYQPTPDQMKTLSKASVLVLNGIGLEFWADKMVVAAGNPNLIVLKTAHGLPLIVDPQESSSGGNPHVWLNPVYAMHQVATIRDALIAADPTHSKLYVANTDSYIQRLQKLDADTRTAVRTFKTKQFIVQHPSWVYFAREYGLSEVVAIETNPGKEPAPQHIKRVVDIARRIKARAIFAEPQSSSKSAQVVADEVGAKVLYLNPMGDSPEYRYIPMMENNVRQLSYALK